MTIEINCHPLPCAAIQEDIDDYINRLDQFYCCKSYQSLHHTKENKYILTTSQIGSNFNVGVISKYHTLDDLENNKIELYLNPRFGPCCPQSEYLKKNDLLLTGFDNGSVALIECENLSLIETQTIFHNNVTSLRLSFDEKMAVGGDLSSRIAVLDLEEFRALHYYDPAHSSKINDLAFHPEDGRMFVSVADNELVLWDVRSKIPATVLISTSTTPIAVLFPEPERLFFGTEGGKIVDFDLRSRKTNKIESFMKDLPISRMELLGAHKQMAVISDGSLKNGSSIGLFDFDLNELKSESFSKNRINNIFLNNSKCYLLGEESMFTMFCMKNDTLFK